VRSCPARLRNVRQGLITVLRGLSLHGTVLSCPVRLVKVMSAEVFRGVVSYGGAGSCPAGSSGAWFSRVRRFMVRSGCAGWATVERCFVLYGKVRFYRGVVWRCPVWCCGEGGVLHSKVRSYCGMVWRCPVWLCGVQWGTVLQGKVLLWHGLEGWCGAKRGSAQHGLVSFYCGVVWSVEALHGIVKFCPVKHCVAGLGIILVWCGDVRWGAGRSCLVRHAELSFWQGGVLNGIAWRGSVGRCFVESGLVRLGAVGQALLSLWLGPVGCSGVLPGKGGVMLCTVRQR